MTTMAGYSLFSSTPPCSNGQQIPVTDALNPPVHLHFIRLDCNYAEQTIATISGKKHIIWRDNFFFFKNTARMLKPSVTLTCDSVLAQPSTAFEPPNFTLKVWVNMWYRSQTLSKRRCILGSLPRTLLSRSNKSTMCPYECKQISYNLCHIVCFTD